jgi:hypothetical protein
MMGDMHGPEKPDFMIKPVQPIIKKILRQQQNNPISDRMSQGENLMNIKIIQD